MICDRFSLHCVGDIVTLFVKFYPEFTRLLEIYVPVSSTVPVCCITIYRNVMI